MYSAILSTYNEYGNSTSYPNIGEPRQHSNMWNKPVMEGMELHLWEVLNVDTFSEAECRMSAPGGREKWWFVIQSTWDKSVL